MISTRVPKDVRAYKTKTVGMFTTRQFFSVLLALFFDFIIYSTLIKDGNLSMETSFYIMTFVSAPFLMVGFFDYMNMPIEEYLKDVFIFKILSPQKRKVKNVIYENKVSVTKLTAKEQKLLESSRPELKAYS